MKVVCYNLGSSSCLAISQGVKADPKLEEDYNGLCRVMYGHRVIQGYIGPGITGYTGPGDNGKENGNYYVGFRGI